jgi:hypothetical protein
LNFLGPNTKSPYCPAQCKEALDNSAGIPKLVYEAINKIAARKGCVDFEVLDKTIDVGGPCKDPWRSAIAGPDGTLTIAIGAVDVANVTLSIKGAVIKQHGGCCLFQISGTAQVQVKDKYDFKTTLQKTASRRSSFWCAAVLEDSQRGTVFTTSCITKEFLIRPKNMKICRGDLSIVIPEPPNYC